MKKWINPQTRSVSRNNVISQHITLIRFSKNKFRLLLLGVLFFILISPAFIIGNSGLSQTHNNNESTSIQNIQVNDLSIASRAGNDISTNNIIIEKSSILREEDLTGQKLIKPPFLPVGDNNELDSESSLINYGVSGGTIIPAVSETVTTPNGCINPTADFLIVDHGQVKSHIFTNNFPHHANSYHHNLYPINQYQLSLLDFRFQF